MITIIFFLFNIVECIIIIVYEAHMKLINFQGIDQAINSVL